MARFILPIQKGTDLFPQQTRIPVAVRAINMPDTDMAAAMLDGINHVVDHFYRRCTHEYHLSGLHVSNRHLDLGGVKLTYKALYGVEQVDVEIADVSDVTKFDGDILLILKLQGDYRSLDTEGYEKLLTPNAANDDFVTSTNNESLDAGYVEYIVIDYKRWQYQVRQALEAGAEAVETDAIDMQIVVWTSPAKETDTWSYTSGMFVARYKTQQWNQYGKTEEECGDEFLTTDPGVSYIGILPQGFGTQTWSYTYDPTDVLGRLQLPPSTADYTSRGAAQGAQQAYISLFPADYFGCGGYIPTAGHWYTIYQLYTIYSESETGPYTTSYNVRWPTQTSIPAHIGMKNCGVMRGSVGYNVDGDMLLYGSLVGNSFSLIERIYNGGVPVLEESFNFQVDQEPPVFRGVIFSQNAYIRVVGSLSGGVHELVDVVVSYESDAPDWGAFDYSVW